MKDIISASRRTDIPAFYFDWLITQLNNGFVDVPNPVFKDKITRVNLSKENIHSLILWSKDFSIFLNNMSLLDDYNLYFQYTITGYSKNLEPNVPEYSETMKTLEKMLSKYSPKQFNIRFDPIILSTKGEVTPTIDKPGLARLKMFETLLKDLKTLGMEDCRLTTSYISLYDSTINKLKNNNIDFINLSENNQIEFMKRMVDIAEKYDRDIYTCANDKFVNAGLNRVKKGHCIDGDILENLFGKCTHANDSGQREECGCVKSKDIGSYMQPCKFSCKYCYAKH